MINSSQPKHRDSRVDELRRHPVFANAPGVWVLQQSAETLQGYVDSYENSVHGVTAPPEMRHLKVVSTYGRRVHR